MQKYIARRLLQTVLVLFVMSVLIFAALRLLPGDPAVALLGKKGTSAALAEVRHELGLDRPIFVQYFIWIKSVLRGDFGISMVTKQSVTEMLKQKLPATLLLTAAATLVGLMMTIPLGIISGLRPHSLIDNFATTFSLLGVAMPSFWVGIVLVIFFGVDLRILPAGGYVKPSEDLGQSLLHLILPAITVGIQLAASETRFLRSGMLDVMGADYIRTARAKGLGENTVVLRHALKNALLTVVTVFALDFGTLLGGELVVETVFFWPGIGMLLVKSIQNRDYGAVQAVVLFVTIIYVGVNMLADLAYGYLDPRIRYD
jgi:peptide/nickel transport system permease protein